MAIGLKLPSVNFVVSMVIALAVVALALRMMPENVKAWFRW